MNRQPGIAVVIVISLCLVGVAFWGARKGNGRTGEVHANAAKAQEQVASLDVPPVQVLVTKFEQPPGQFVYKYTVVNGSAFPITNVQIGMDYFRGISELGYAPTGWDGGSVPSSSYRTPPGWTFQSMVADEDTVGYLQWSITRPGEAIAGGASLGGFEVNVPVYDVQYEAGHWTVLLNSADEPTYSGGLQASGVTGVPISSMFAKSDLRISPNPARGRVGIKFSVSKAGLTTVDVFDVRGRLVKRLEKRPAPEGESSVSWDGLNESGAESAAGVYFVRVRTPTTLRFGRITWLRETGR